MFKKLCWLMLVVMTVMPLMGFVVASTVPFGTTKTLWGTEGNIGTAHYAICNKITKDGRNAIATGILKNGYVYCYDAIFATSWILVVYDASYNLVAVSDTSTTFASNGWVSFTFSGANQVTLTLGQTYYVSPWAKSAVDVGSFGNLKDYANGPSYPTVPDPVSFNDWAKYDSATYLTGK